MARERHFLKFPNCSHSLKRAAKLRRKAALSQAAAAGAAAAAATTTGAAAGVAAAVGNGPPAPVSDDGGSKVDDVMGVGEDPVGEDGHRQGVWHYGVITGVVTEWVLEDYGGATQWRAVFEDGDIVGLLRSEVVEAMAAAQEHPPVDADGEARLVTVHEGSGKVTVQSGWVMEDCLHHMETFSILNAGPLLEEARNVVTEEDGPERKAQVDALPREGRTRYPARRQGAAAGAARRQGAAAGAARRQGAAAGAARRQDSAYSGIGGEGCITSCGRQPLKTMRSCRNNPTTGFWIPLIWLAAAGCGMQGRMTEVAVLVSPESLHAAEAAQPHRH
eukprot:jgi/Tetstr1/447072/TSEL_034510.t1